MNHSKVSVVIPAYNHERYVGEAIRSVLDQTFRDFELIIINDGSTDRTETEILKFKDDRIRYYSQSNRGLSATLNRGIDLARGDYFSFLPSDDLFFPEKIEAQLKEFQTGSPDLGMVFSRQIVVDAIGNEITEDPIIDWFDTSYRTKEEIFPALFERNFLPAPTFMGRKACFEKVGSFDESLRYCQDYDMWFRMLKVYDIRIVDKPLLRYRWHGENLTYAKTERADFERAVLLLKAIKILDLTDIFPSLKGLEKRGAPERYATSYKVLARHLLKSGLIEVMPVAYGLMEEAWKLEPSLELEKEMEDLVRRRPHFLDLRDERLGQLSQQVADLNHRLNRLYQFQSVLEKQKEALDQQEKAFRDQWEKKKQALDQQEKEMIEKTRRIEERENGLQRWQQELLDVQGRLDQYVRRPHIRALRFLYRGLKVLWRSLPDSVRKPIRSLLKEKLFPSGFQTRRVETAEMQQSPMRSIHESPPFLVNPAEEHPLQGKLSQMKQPTVSVVLPVYNQSYLVEEAIKSVLNQTYPNLELIIVNDGSTDRVNEILPRYAFHEKIILLQQENQGLPRTLTNGFRHATGSFLTWTSADNILLPNQVEVLVDFLLRHPEVDMVYSNVEIIDDSGSPALNSNYRRHNQFPLGSNRIYLPREVKTLGVIEDNFVNASFLYRSSVGKAIGEYDPCLLGTEDYDYWLRINSLFTLRHLDSDEILYQYRVHADSLSERFGKSDIFENAKKLIQYHREREAYYQSKFDVFIFTHQNHDGRGRHEHLARAFRDQGHQVIWLTLRSERAGEVVKRDGMAKVFIKDDPPGRIRETLLPLRQYRKALILLTTPIEKALLEELKSEDVFVFIDIAGDESMGDMLLETADSVSVRSQYHRDRLSERLRNKSHLIRDGIIGEKLIRKARDNFYSPHEFPWLSGKNLAYYGPLRKESFDSSLFHEVVRMKRDWNFVLLGTPGEVDNDLANKLVGLGNVYFLGEKPCSGNGNLYQDLSSVSVLWAPVLGNEKYEEHLQRMIEIAGLSGRPLLLPTGLNHSEIPFVFPFGNAHESAGLLNLLARLRTDHEIFDRWLSRNSWEEKAKWFTGIANNSLYYRKTREPLKRNLKLVDYTPAVYRSNEGKMNVLLQVKSLDKGGLEEVVLNLVYHFDYRKVNVLVLCEEKGGAIADQCKGFGIMVKVLGDAREKEYREILKKYSIGVVNPHYATFGLRVAHELGIPVVPVLHNTYAWMNEEEINRFKRDDQYVSQYIAVSENVARYTIEKFGIPPKKIKVIPNGLDISKQERMQANEPVITRESLGIDKDDSVLLNVATFDGRKGHHALISALKGMKGNSQVKVVCVGSIADERYFSRLKERLMKEGLERQMILHDYVDEISSFYRLADAFVLPSLIEGWSISVMEAMFHGLPLILTDVGGNKEILERVGNGILIPTSYGDTLQLDHRGLGRYCLEEEPQNTEALANAMKDILDRRVYWKERGERGKAAIHENHSIDKTARAYEEVFLAVRKGSDRVGES